MKKIIISILVLLVAFSILAKTGELPDAGLTPDSPFYFLKAWKESIQTFFTFGAENKAKQYLHLAEVRLAEYQRMIEKGKTEIAQKTLEKYEKQLNNALKKAEELKNKGTDIKDISQKIEQAVSKHLEVLQENLQKVPESAKKGIENAIENSQKGAERILEKKLEKPDETANWKIYRNEEYGFEVKYPKEWGIEKIDVRHGVDFTYVWNDGGFCILNIEYSLTNNSYELMEKFYNTYKTYRSYDLQKTESVIGGIKAVKFDYIYSDQALRFRFSQPMSMTSLFFNSGDKYYSITRRSDLNIHKDVCINLVNQILSTFKFIE